MEEPIGVFPLPDGSFSTLNGKGIYSGEDAEVIRLLLNHPCPAKQEGV